MNNNQLKKRGKILISLAIVVALMFMVEPIYGNFGANSNSNVTTASSLLVSNQGKSSGTVIADKYDFSNAVSSSSPTPWTFPTNTTQEPGYTGGIYVSGLAGPPGDLNPYTSDTIIDGTVFGDVYMPLYQTFLNGSLGPSLATGYTLTIVPSTSNHTTFDLETGQYENYSAIYTVHLRPGVLWTDWTAANASQTYVFSNVTDYNNTTGVPMPHTFKSYKTMNMLKYELQAGDVVCSWRIGDTYGKYPGIVNAVPVNNLTVNFYVSKPNLLVVYDSFTNYVLPYNIWHHHNFASVSGYFNYSPNLTSAQAANAFNSWNMGWNLETGAVPGLVGNGPFMVSNSLGVPQGEVIPNHVIIEYENPYFFFQYTNASAGLRQWTPKIYAMEWKEFVSVASLQLALDQGQLDGIGGICAGDIPQYLSVPNSEVLSSPAGVYNLLDFNVHSAVAPLNCTNFRYALNYAIPKSYIASDICHGDIPGQTWMIPANTLFFNSSTPSYSFNMAKARSILNSTPGFSLVSGKLYYYGKPVTLTVDILSTAIAATIDLAMYVIQGDWEELGITVNFNLVSVGTMFSDLSAVQDGSSNNSFQIENFCDSNGIGDPALCCAVRYNPTYGLPACSYIGPFSPITMNGKNYTGSQVQALMDNLTVEALNTNSIVTAEKLVKEMQGIEAIESIIIPLGYVPGHTPLLLTYFKNQSAMGEGFCYWNALSVQQRSTPLSVPHVASLQIKTSVTQNAYSSGEFGNITIAVSKDGTPLSGVNITVGYSATYSGVLNVSSCRLVTNSQGIAVFEFETTTSLKDLLGLASVSYENINFTIVATQQNFQTTPPSIVASNTTTLTLIGTACNVTQTSSPPSVSKSSAVPLIYELGLIVSVVVAIAAITGLVYTRFKYKKK